MSVTSYTSGAISSPATTIYNENSSKNGLVPFLQRNVTARVGFLAAAAVTPFSAAADLAGGAVLAALSIATLGCVKPLNKKALELTGDGLGAPASIFSRALKVINPAAITVRKKGEESIIRSVVHSVATKAFILAQSKNFVERELLSRLVNLAYIPTAIVTRVAELVVGIFATVGSLVLLGTNKQLNIAAIDGFSAIGAVINDIYFGLLRTINPHAF